MLFSCKVAFRFLKEGKHQTVFILVGIILAVSVQVYISNMINAMDKSILDSTIGISSQLTVEPKKPKISGEKYLNHPVDRKKISDYKKIITFLSTVNEITAISPVVNANALYTQGNTFVPLSVKGIELENADKIYQIRDKIVDGEFSLNTNQILIGKKFADENEISAGDSVKLNFGANRQITFFVSGIYDLKSEIANSSNVFINIERAQKIMDIEGSVNAIETKLKDPFMQPKVVKKIRPYLQDVNVTGWQETNRIIMIALRGQKASSALIQAFVIFAVALSMSSVLGVSVVQKSKEIGILKAMGSTNKDTSMIFVVQGGILGCIGSIFGYGLGVILVNFFFDFLNKLTESSFAYYPSTKAFLMTVAAATIIGMTASLVPARKSASLNPMEVIRNA